MSVPLLSLSLLSPVHAHGTRHTARKPSLLRQTHVAAQLGASSLQLGGGGIFR